ncbi:MAG: site-specific integrase [Litoricola sp.]|jgi:integrase|nr:site-specific integrase [Litorivicinus sp.]
MASIRKRNNRWQVQVRSRIYGSISKSFHRKSDAQKWAIEQEALMQSGQWSRTMDRGSRVSDLLSKYLSDVTPKKRHPDPEKRRLNRLLNDPVANHHLETFDSTAAAQFRDRRLADGPRTTEYDLVLLRHAWNIAKVEWGWALGPNPLEKIKFPKPNPARERRLMPGEFARLQAAASEMSCWYLWPIVQLAIETAMRKGELLSLQWSNIDLEKSIALLPHTKNGSSRWVPLSPRASEILLSLDGADERVFPIGSDALRHGWDRLCKKAEIEGLRFHDLRHEAVSRLFEMNLTVPEVAFISGHKTPSQLLKYAHITCQRLWRYDTV